MADDAEASNEFAHTRWHTNTHSSSLPVPPSMCIGNGGGTLDGREELCRTYYSVTFRENLMTRLLRHLEEGLCFRTEPYLTRPSVKHQPNLSSPHHTLLGCTLAPCVYICVWVCAPEHVQYVFKPFRQYELVSKYLSMHECVLMSVSPSARHQENNGFSLNEVKQQQILFPHSLPPPFTAYNILLSLDWNALSPWKGSGKTLTSPLCRM